MGSMSIWHWIIVLRSSFCCSRRGKISELMGDFAKGIKSFKKGMTEEAKPTKPSPRRAGEDHRPSAVPGNGRPATGGAPEPQAEPARSAERRGALTRPAPSDAGVKAARFRAPWS